MKFFLKAGLVSCLLVLAVVVLILNGKNNNKTRRRRLPGAIADVESPKSRLELEKSYKDLAYDEYCHNYSDWRMLAEMAFFKQSTSFYFLDLNVIVLNFLHHYSQENNDDLQFEVIIRVENGTYKQTLKKFFYISDTSESVSNYDRKMIKIDFNLNEFLKSIDNNSFATIEPDRVSLDVNVVDVSGHIRTNKPIRLTITSSNHGGTKSKGMLICLKESPLNSDDGSFQQWFKLMSALKYEDIVGYHESGRTVTDRQLDFLWTMKLNSVVCVPNIFDSEPISFRFLKSYDDQQIPDVFEMLMLAECYLNNMGQFEYVLNLSPYQVPFIGDAATQLDISFDSNHFENFLSKVSTVRLGELFVAKNYDHTSLYSVSKQYDSDNLYVMSNFLNLRKSYGVKSFSVNVRKYLRQHDVAQLCLELNNFIDAKKSRLKSEASRTILLNEIFNATVGAGKFKRLNVRINGLKELIYALYLCELNRLIVVPSVRKQMPQISFEQKYVKFFYMASTPDKQSSVYDTNQVIMFDGQYPILDYVYDNKTNRVSFSPFNMLDDESGNKNYGFIGDFGQLIMDETQPHLIDIKDIRLDLSYFFWFFKKIN